MKSFMKDGVPTVTPREVLDGKDLTLVDVRMPDEYIGELGHVEGTRLATLGPELETYLKTEEKSKTIIFICRSGIRSGRATAAALALGFKSSYNMDGGMLAWNEHGLPVTK
jgi:rhodanese-related sulfurtransferase